MASQYHPTIIGRRGATVTEIRKKFDVNVQFPEANKSEVCSLLCANVTIHIPGYTLLQDLIKVIGYEENTKQARDHILGIVSELESHVSQDVHIDKRVHPRLIGAKGRAIKKIMEDFQVSG